MIAINLSKQQALDADSKVIKQINFIGNLERDNGTTILFIIGEAKKNNSFKRNFESIVKSIVNLFYFNTISILNTQCRALNVKFSDSQLNKIKSWIKNGAEVTLKISSNVASDSNDENNFLHKLLLTNTQFSKLRKAFANNFSANIKVSKIQFHKIGQSGGFLGTPLGPLPKTGLPLMKNLLKPLAKSVLIPLGLTAASATDAAVHKKNVWIGNDYTDNVKRRNEWYYDNR